MTGFTWSGFNDSIKATDKALGGKIGIILKHSGNGSKDDSVRKGILYHIIGTSDNGVGEDRNRE